MKIFLWLQKSAFSFELAIRGISSELILSISSGLAGKVLKIKERPEVYYIA